MELRPYQKDSVNAIFDEWQNHKSTLVIQATGTGKTIVFSEVTKRLREQDKKILILAHRSELLEQTQNKLALFNVDSVLEKAENHANIGADNVVVASIQSISRDDRLNNYPQDYFDAIIIDEAHHSASDTYLKVINYFSNAKLLGVTATPNRADVRNISDVFETVAYSYNTKDAIDDGYLSPISIRRIPITIDLSNVRTSCGDFLSSDLQDTLEPYLGQIADELKDKAQGRKTIIFTPTIAIGEQMATLLEEKGFNSCCVSSKNTKEERADIIKKFHIGELNVITNSMLWTEGFDEPSVDCIINLRATKSESLYRQILGRGLRLSPETNKENLLVLDFLWHSGRKGYDVLSPIDLFIDKSRMDIADAILNEEDEEISLEDLQSKADAKYLLAENLKNASKKTFMGNKFEEVQNPFIKYYYDDNELDCIVISNDKAVTFYTDEEMYEWTPLRKWELTPCSDKQKEFLKNAGFDLDHIPYKGLGAKLIDNVIRSREKNKCSFKQYEILKRKGFINVQKWTKEEVAVMIDKIANNHWRLPYGIRPRYFIPESLKPKEAKRYKEMMNRYKVHNSIVADMER